MPPTLSSARFCGFYLAVGGQAHKVGKSELVVDILKAFPHLNWSAIKITPYTGCGCPLNGPSCNCAPNEDRYAIHNETQRGSQTDSSRFLTAGARRALWLQTKKGQLQAALPALIEQLNKERANSVAGEPIHVIIESDALVKLWKPSLFLMVLDPTNPDFKASAWENLARADAFVFRSPENARGAQKSRTLAPARAIDIPATKPKFLHPLGSPMPPDLRQFLSDTIPLTSGI